MSSTAEASQERLAEIQAIVREQSNAGPARVQVQHNWDDLRKKVASRRAQLESALHYQQFLRDASEMGDWVAVRMKTALDEEQGDHSKLAVTIKKHRAFDQEVNANLDVLETLRDDAQDMIAESHFAAESIASKMTTLDAAWTALVTQSARKTQLLEQRQRLVDFDRDHADFIASVARNQGLAKSTDVGTNLQECEKVQKAFEEFANDVAANAVHLTSLVDLAKQSHADSHPRAPHFEQRAKEAQAAWDELAQLLSARRQKLAEAHQIHTFVQEHGEISDRIEEKLTLVSKQDVGSNVAQVEVLLRTHQGIQRDMIAVDESVRALVSKAETLVSAYPDRTSHVAQLSISMQAQWKDVNQKAAARLDKLQDSLLFQRFLVDYRAAIAWIGNMKQTLKSKDIMACTSTADSSTLRQQHEENTGETAARQVSFDAVRDIGTSYAQRGHFASTAINDSLSTLQTERDSLTALVTSRKWDFEQCHDLQLFKKEIRIIADWIVKQEQAIENKPLGDSVDTVHALLKKHDDFESSLRAQEDKMKSLIAFVSKMESYQHYDKPTIVSMLDNLRSQRKELVEHSNKRRSLLLESLANEKHRRDTKEITQWIEDRLKVALDGAHLDPTNIQAKIKRHADFDREVAANLKGVSHVQQEGKKLIQANNFAKEDIEARLQQLDQDWQNLKAKSVEKTHNLKETSEFVDFSREVRDIEEMLVSKLAVAEVTNVGENIDDCKLIQKKFDVFCLDVSSAEGIVDSLGQLADRLVAQQHSRSTEIEDLKSAVFLQWDALCQAVQTRKQLLSEAAEIHRFIRDASETLEIIQSKEDQLTDDYGSDVAGVEAFIRTHETFARDILAVGETVEALILEADRLIAAYPDRTDPVVEQQGSVALAYESLKEKSALRHKMLNDSLDYQRFLVDFNTSISWIQEMTVAIQSEDVSLIPEGDVDGAEALLSLHGERRNEIDARQPSFKHVHETARTLCSTDHFAKDVMQASAEELEQEEQELAQLWAERQEEFKEALDIRIFQSDAAATDAWVNSQSHLLGSDELGSDIDSVEEMLRKMEDLEKTLVARGEKAKAIENFAGKIASNPRSPAVKRMDRGAKQQVPK